MKMNHVMLDLETLGNKPNSVILAIGACAFERGRIVAEFYQRIEAGSCTRAGLQMDTDTVLWWMQQKDEARLELCKPGGVDLKTALSEFTTWIGDNNPCLWGNGSDFDNVILRNAYDRMRHHADWWKFWNNRCYRTVKALNPGIRAEKPTVAHNALADAIAQAKHLMRIWGDTLAEQTGNDRTLFSEPSTRSEEKV